MLEKHIEFLGKTVVDKVTNFKGAVTSICFDLYGCVQVILTAKVDKHVKPYKNYK